MKYILEIELELSRERVGQLFGNVANLKKWQPDLVNFQHISGEPGQVGAKSKMLYKMGKREIEMIETITESNLPEAFNGTYEAKGVMNWVNNTFVEVATNKTKWITENEFQFSGFMKLIGFFMKNSFPKQSYKYMEQFKAFAENEA